MGILAPRSWRVTSLVYHDLPVLVASYDFPDTRSRPMRDGLNSLAQNFTKYNLRPVDRYLRPLHKADDSCNVLLVETGLTAQFRMKDVFPGTGTPDGEWLDLASTSGRCVLAITVGDVDADHAQQHLRIQAGRDLCWAAEVRFLDMRFPGEWPDKSRYKFLGADGERPFPLPLTAAVSLDSNVVLDLEKAARGKVSEPLHQELASLIQNIRHQDCRPAFAFSELCWDSRTGGFRHDRLVSLAAAIDAWFDDDRSPGSLTSERIQSRWAERLEHHTAQGAALHEYDFRPQISAIYCCLLKLSTLLLQIDGFRARQRVDLLNEYARWVDEEFGYVLVYPLHIAFDALVGDPSKSAYTRKLLKFSKNTLRDLWGASWDIFMLTIATDLIAAGKGFDPVNLRDAGLVTADKGLVEIRSRLTFHGILQNTTDTDDWRPLIAAQYIIDKRLQEHAESIVARMKKLRLGAHDRLTSPSPGMSVSDLNRRIEVLEAEVLEKRTLDKNKPQESARSLTQERSTTSPSMPWWSRYIHWRRRRT